MFERVLITPAEEKIFLSQALTKGKTLDIQLTMTKNSIDTLDMKIRTDLAFRLLSKPENVVVVGCLDSCSWGIDVQNSQWHSG